MKKDYFFPNDEIPKEEHIRIAERLMKDGMRIKKMPWTCDLVAQCIANDYLRGIGIYEEETMEETCQRAKKEKTGGKIMKAKKEIPICPKCGSKESRARIKTGELWCRRCGHVGKREEFYERKGCEKNGY